MDASAHRANAREALRGNWFIAVLVFWLASLISGSGTGLNINFKFTDGITLDYSVPENMETVLHSILGIAMPVVLTIAGVLLAVGLILGGVMALGTARFSLNLIDRKEARIEDLFSGFPRFAQALLMYLLNNLLVLLGTCLLIVPGVILIYSFAMAPYILAEDPDCTGWEALKRSRAMMQGHKGELFWLDLTFLGWGILSAFTFGIGGLFLTPYQETARASFYRNLKQQNWDF